MRTWAEVSLDNLAHNYRTIRETLPQGCRFLGVVKANAYGHGIGEIGRKLEKLGCEGLAGACLDEAMELRRVGVTAPILCLGQTPAPFAHLLLECGVTQTVSDLDTAKALSAAATASGKKLKIHIKLDTGMTRLGFLWQEGREERALEEIAERSSRALPPPTVNFKGIVGKEPYPVTKKAGQIIRTLVMRGIERLKKLFKGNKSRSEIVATFLAVLELCKPGSATLEDDISGENPNIRLIKTPEQLEQEAVNGEN